MHKHRFQGDISHLRSPERLARLEIDRATYLALQGEPVRNVLDVGTGSGVFAQAFADLGIKAVGLDADPSMISQARCLVPNANFCLGLAEYLPFKDGSFDLVFMGLLLHEADDPAKVMHEAARVVTGAVIILEWPYSPSRSGPPSAERLSEEQIRSMAREAGLHSVNVIGLSELVLYRLDRGNP